MNVLEKGFNDLYRCFCYTLCKSMQCKYLNKCYNCKYATSELMERGICTTYTKKKEGCINERKTRPIR